MALSSLRHFMSGGRAIECDNRDAVSLPDLPALQRHPESETIARYATQFFRVAYAWEADFRRALIEFTRE